MKSSALMRMLLLGSLWGPSFFFIKIALESIPPLTISGVRFGLAALLLWIWLLVKRYRVPNDKKLWKHLFVMSIFSMTLPISLINYAEQYIDSNVAGTINGTVPIITVLLAHFALQDEKITITRLLGLCFGLLGFLLLLVPTLFNHDIKIDSSGLVMVALAACCYAIGMVYGKRYIAGQRSVAIPTIQLTFAFILSTTAACLFEHPWTLTAPSTPAILALIGLAVLGTALAFIVYYYVLSHDGPVALSMTTYLLPPYAIIFGFVFLNESLHWQLAAALVLILLGIRFVNKRPTPVSQAACAD